MNFSGYQEFRNKFEKSYGSYQVKYPNAFLVLDFPAQLRVLQEYDNSWVNDSHIQHYFDQTIKLDFSTKFYSIFLRMTAFFRRIRPSKKITIHSSIQDTNFPGFNNMLDYTAKKNGWNLIYGIQPVSSFWDIISLKVISPYRSFLSTRTKKILSEFNKRDKIQWFELLKNERMMTALDNSVKSDIKKLDKLLYRLGINVFINTGDSSANARVLIEACSTHNIKTISLAHGYISDFTLIGIAPVRSDKLILWTEKQLTEFLNVVDEIQANRLDFIGFPKKINFVDQPLSDQSILLVTTSIEPMLNDLKKKHFLKKVILELKKISPNFRLRLHPNERINIPKINDFLAENPVNLANGDLMDEIAKSNYIVGFSSSVLLEAVSSGKPVFEIKELTDPLHEFESIKKISIDEIQNIHDIDFNPTNHKELFFNKKKISLNLQRLIESIV